MGENKQLSIGEEPKKVVPVTQKEILDALYSLDTDVIVKSEYMNYVLNQPPRKEWIKEHPYITGYKYLPIDKVEYLLTESIQKYKNAPQTHKCLERIALYEAIKERCVKDCG